MLRETQAKVLIENYQILSEYEGWDEQFRLEVFDHRRSFDWKGTQKGKRGYAKEEAPRVLRSELATAFFECRTEESSGEIAAHLWEGKPAYGPLILVAQALGDQAPGPRFKHLRESYEALCASVGERNKSIESALEKWEQKVRRRLNQRAAQMTKERPNIARRQRLIRRLDDALKTYTNLTKTNRATHIQRLLQHFGMLAPKEEAIQRSLPRKIRTK